MGFLVIQRYSQSWTPENVYTHRRPLGIVPKSHRQGLRTVVLIRKHRDKHALCSSASIPRQTGLLGQLDQRAEVVDVRDAELVWVCQGGGAGVVDLGGFGGAENDTPPYGLAGFAGDCVAAGVAEVVEAWDGDEGGAGEGCSGW